MKKAFFIIILTLSASVVFAQLKVTPGGNVGIGIANQTPISKLAVGHVGDQISHNYFYGDKYTMLIHSTGTNSNGMGCGIRSHISVQGTSHGGAAINGYAYKDTPFDTGRAIGVLGYAHDATHGYNYGVAGLLAGTHNGTGILGSSTSWTSSWIYVDGKYAGYFQGDVKVTGTLNGTVISPSDMRYKQNVTDLSSRGDREVLKTITRLVPISYNLKQAYYDVVCDSLQQPLKHFDENSVVFKKKHFGLIAQDLQKIYPELVYENDNGYLSINYTELIPLLIQSIKELKEEVDILSMNTRSATSSDPVGDLPRAVLYQNAPNPFSERTVIKFDLPDNAASAFIYIFNMQGALIKQLPLNRQQSSVTINGSELTAGMYLYSLIVDGKEIDTKRMILTK